jgi:hypothetical protein
MHRIYSALLIFIIAAPATPAADAVKINRHAPAIDHRKFNRDHPPKELPALEGDEAAVTRSILGIESQFSFDVLPAERGSGPATHKIKVAAVTADLSLSITIWLPDDAAKVIIDHEEGHRQISESFYKDSEKIARSIADKYIGQTYSAEGDDAEAAIRKALDKVQNEFLQKYMAQTQVVSARANEIFDQLTDHGRNEKITVQDAIKKSIERAKKEKK